MKASTTLADEAYSAIAELDPSGELSTESLAQRLRFYGTSPEFDSPHKLTLAAAAAIGVYALGVEHWWHMARDQRQTISIDWMQAASSLNPGHFQKQSGYSLPALSLLTELKADFYLTKDDRWFFPIGSYPHLRDGVLDLLQCANSAEALGGAIGTWNARDLEEAFAKAKLPGIFARTTEEWLSHPQGTLLDNKPVIEV